MNFVFHSIFFFGGKRNRIYFIISILQRDGNNEFYVEYAKCLTFPKINDQIDMCSKLYYMQCQGSTRKKVKCRS